jgi:hypothetical protein
MKKASMNEAYARYGERREGRVTQRKGGGRGGTHTVGKIRFDALQLLEFVLLRCKDLRKQLG